MPAYRDITPKVKDRKFVKEYAKHGNGVQAALAAYTDNYGSAQAIAHRKLKQPAIRQAIEQALINQGIDAEWIIEKRKRLISIGMDSVVNGETKIQATDINKSLEGLERLLVREEQQSGNSLHVHMNVKPLSEVKQHAKELDGYFKGILEDGEVIDE